MSDPLRRHLTYANVMATAAVFLTLGGVSYAAVVIPKNSVGNPQLKVNAVTTGKIKNGTLLAADFKRGQLPRGATGAPGAAGVTGPQGTSGSSGAEGPARDARHARDAWDQQLPRGRQPRNYRSGGNSDEQQRGLSGRHHGDQRWRRHRPG